MFKICSQHAVAGSAVLKDAIGGRSYAPQGHAPIVRVNNKHHGLSVISTIANGGSMRWKVLDGARSTRTSRSTSSSTWPRMRAESYT